MRKFGLALALAGMMLVTGCAEAPLTPGQIAGRVNAGKQAEVAYQSLVHVGQAQVIAGTLSSTKFREMDNYAYGAPLAARVIFDTTTGLENITDDYRLARQTTDDLHAQVQGF